MGGEIVVDLGFGDRFEHLGIVQHGHELGDGDTGGVCPEPLSGKLEIDTAAKLFAVTSDQEGSPFFDRTVEPHLAFESFAGEGLELAHIR